MSTIFTDVDIFILSKNLNKILLWTSAKSGPKHERKACLKSSLLQGEPVGGLRPHDVTPIPESSPTKQTESGQEVRQQSRQQSRQFRVGGSSPGQEDELDGQPDRILCAQEH